MLSLISIFFGANHGGAPPPLSISQLSIKTLIVGNGMNVKYHLMCMLKKFENTKNEYFCLVMLLKNITIFGTK